jgi:uncharacterized protein YprB with RNaseH-like and TPR domain
MNEQGNDSVARQLELLRRLGGKGLRRGSDLAADQGEGRSFGPGAATHEAQAGAKPCRGTPVLLSRLFPEAEALGEADGARLWRLRTTLPTDGRPTRQGCRCPASDWGGPPDMAALATLADLAAAPAWAGLDPGRVVYLDVETSGLATGSGSVAFLVGLGRFAPGGGAFELEQYYIDDFAAEPLLIAALEERLAEAQALVTYNGRTFDLPLLATRWVMARRRPRFPELHLDLLGPARRLWRLRLPDCRLGTVEREILGVRRLSDLPGHLIPGVWLDAQRGLRPERLAPVFDHHAQDIATLGALAALLGRAVREPGHPAFAHAEDQLGLARLAEARGDRAEALRRLEASVLAARDPALEFRLAMRLARAYKRAGRVEDAVESWRARVAQCRPGRLEPLVELAKHAEHVQKDHEAARRWTEQALAILRASEDLATRGLAGEALSAPSRRDQILALEHRRARQGRRLARHAPDRP